ncbi:MAG: hypothetical protein ACYC4L_20345 [Chloroflexota bacterium]
MASESQALGLSGRLPGLSEKAGEAWRGLASLIARRFASLWQPTWLSWLRLVFVVYLGLFCYFRIWKVQGRAALLPVLDGGLVLLPLLAGLLCALAAWRTVEHRERWAWRCFGAAFVACGLGEALWLTGPLGGAGDGSWQISPDLAFQTYYPLMLAALVLLLPRNTGIYGWIGSVLDALLFTAGPLALCWWVAQPVSTLPGGPLATLSNGVWLPGDFILMFLLVMLAVRWPLERVPRWLGFLLTAFLTALVADSLSVVLESTSNQNLLPVLDVVYAGSYGLAARAAVARLGLTGESESVSLARWRTVRVLMPYLALPVAGLVVYGEFRSGVDADTPWVLSAAAVVITIVLIRQMMTVRSRERPLEPVSRRLLRRPGAARGGAHHRIGPADARPLRAQPRGHAT